MNEVQSFLLEGLGIRGAIVRLAETWQQIVAQHQYPTTVEQLLGESVAATVLMADGLKHRPKVSIQLQGDGPLRLLLIQCAPDFKVRGMAQWRSFAPGDALLGQGRLAVTVDTGQQNGLFQGIVPLVSNELEDCLEAYFKQSEQLPTRIILQATATGVAGMLLQAMPGQNENAADFERAATVARTVSQHQLQHEAADALLPRVFANYEIRLFKPRPVLHDCRCTPDHLAGIARMLGKSELTSILSEQGAVELTCEFCNRAFRYDADDVETILKGETPVAVLH